MAGRPQLEIGKHGKFYTRKFGDGYQARCRYRHENGQTRLVSATGPTSGAAIQNLQNALQRHNAGNDDLNTDTRFYVAAEQWFVGITVGEKSPSTIDTYRRCLDCHVLPALGQLRLREVSTSRVDRFLLNVRDNAGGGIAKTARTVLSNVLKHALRHGAITTNTTRDTTPLSGKPKKPPRALTKDERVRWLAQLDANPQSVNKDLPDLVSFMLGTGTRIGEALAVAWDQIDFEAATVTIEYTLVRIKGQGLLRKSTKTAAGTRVLTLPPTTVAMLRRRRRAGRIGTLAVFPDSKGGWRDPANTRRDIRHARGTEEFAWVTSHTFRKTAATVLDEAGLSAREIADHMGHSQVSMTQDVYLGRGVVNRRAADALGEGLS